MTAIAALAAGSLALARPTEALSDLAGTLAAGLGSGVKASQKPAAAASQASRATAPTIQPRRAELASVCSSRQVCAMSGAAASALAIRRLHSR